MVQNPNSPESQPQTSPEQAFPPLEEHAGEAPDVEAQAEGREKQAEKQIESDKTDDDISRQADTGNVDNNTTEAPTGTKNDVKNVPDVADDVDVIEKAWVDRAKQIIKETKDDPKAQEDAFEQLQIEYHKKRYGRDIKASR